ncbi:MAG TPA: fibronectin type III domain-containing protein [Patescibacteria group bacterium]|nr:fibronectin type III domain-containing protein [Patescibacteria group bacterium]
MRQSILVVLLIVSSLILLSVRTVKAYYSNMPASMVLGQTNFTDSAGGLGPNKFFDNTTHPTNTGLVGIFVDPLGRLIISDFSNGRVLIWNKMPTTNGAPADLVLGQPDFNSNSKNACACDTPGPNTLVNVGNVYSTGTQLFVADQSNNRVLIWNTFPTHNFQAADVVVGQADFTSTATTCNASTMYIADYVYVYGNKLLVADRNHSRILIWNSIPTVNGTPADIELGHSGGLADCTGSSANASNFAIPEGILVYNGKLFVVDHDYNRILVWNTFPTQNNQPADYVIGQPDFTTTSSGTSASEFSAPLQAYIDNNRLFVTEESNNRIVVFNSVPITNGGVADLVLGQPSFTSNSANEGEATSAYGFNKPRGILVYNNQLFVGDPINARVLIFNNVIGTPQMNINTPFTDIGNGRLELKGNVQLGENGRYAMQWIKADVNGSGLGNVSNLFGGRSINATTTLYDFVNDFDPRINGGSSNNFTLDLVASSFNADTTSLFYFLPFNLNYVRKSNNNLNIDFTVNNLNIQRIKDNIDHFKIEYRKENDSSWLTLVNSISTDKISNAGEINLVTLNVLKIGTKYNVKVVAVSKNSNWEQSSNVLSYFFNVPNQKKNIIVKSALSTSVTSTPLPTLVVDTPMPVLPVPTVSPQAKTCFLFWCW